MRGFVQASFKVYVELVRKRGENLGCMRTRVECGPHFVDCAECRAEVVKRLRQAADSLEHRTLKEFRGVPF